MNRIFADCGCKSMRSFYSLRRGTWKLRFNIMGSQIIMRNELVFRMAFTWIHVPRHALK